MSKSKKRTIGLAELIGQVKREVLESNATHDGEESHFQIEGMDLEIALGATRGGGGKVKLSVVELGSNAAKEQTHKIQLHLCLNDNSQESRSSKPDTKKTVRKVARKTPPKTAARRGGRTKDSIKQPPK